MIFHKETKHELYDQLELVDDIIKAASLYDKAKTIEYITECKNSIEQKLIQSTISPVSFTDKITNNDLYDQLTIVERLERAYNKHLFSDEANTILMQIKRKII